MQDRTSACGFIISSFMTKQPVHKIIPGKSKID
jgi:hypothetical protein